MPPSGSEAEAAAPAPLALVTGGTGFVGAHLIRRLVADGWRVHAIRRRQSRSGEAPVLPEVSWHVHDGTTAGMIAILDAARPQVVFHLASLFLAQHRPEDVDGLIASNVLFATQLIEAMHQVGSGCLVNAGTSWQNYADADYDPVCLYAATKQAFEDIARYYVEACGLRMITLRLFDTYGVADPRPKLFALLQRALASGEVLRMSPGEQLIDLVHIDDVVAAFVLAAERLRRGQVAAAEVYAVSSGRPLPLKELVERFSRALGRPIAVEWGGRPYRPREVMRPWSQGAALPGWTPVVTLDEGLRTLAAEAG